MNDNAQMIGYIEDGVSAKVKTYLLAAKSLVLNAQSAQTLKQLLAQGKDPAQTLALIIGKVIDALESNLGPLEQEEHDQVAFHIGGWLVSSLGEMGMPGLDAPEGRQDLLGRVLQALDGMTQEQGEGAGPQGAAPAGAQGAPMAQFGG